jgi:mannose-6-phosphate isomerase-like protein (cupin superfamily)
MLSHPGTGMAAGVYLNMELNYGFAFDQVKKFNHPSAIMTEWGSWTECAERPEYMLTQICLNKAGIQPMHFHLQRHGAYWVESGEVLVRFRSKDGQIHLQKLMTGHIFLFTPGLAHSLCGLEASIVYGFSNRVPFEDWYNLESETEATRNFNEIYLAEVSLSGERSFDYRYKYWGTIETILNGEVAGKRIFLRANAQASLEFHCVKVETYFVHSGRLKVGLRLGRGENKSVILGPGNSYDVPSGLMHMRIGLEDSVVVEISTRDSDSDSHLVEDGKKYQHIEV